MNNYAKHIVLEFLSEGNYKRMREEISARYNYAVDRYLNEYLREHMQGFSQEIERELSMSEPFPGITIKDQVNEFSGQFLRGEYGFIASYITKTADIPVKYHVNDGMPTGRLTAPKSADDTLRSWSKNPSRGLAFREDTSADVTREEYMHDYFSRGPVEFGGITFCDQSHLGVNNHLDFYENTAFKRNLNNGPAYENTPFGVSTHASDARLLSRRTFRNNEAGVENGIPNKEVRLQRRNLERDVSEGLPGAERGHLNRGYDMQPLYNRIEYKNAIRAQYPTSVDNRVDLFIRADGRPPK